MHLFIEGGMRGGISYISKRHNRMYSCDSKEKSLLFIGM